MEANGFLPIDRVVLRSIGDGNFLVMEGNRRICAAKEITGYSDEGSQLDESIMETLKIVPCLQYEGSGDQERAAWVFQGLRHVTGIAEWPAFNKAKLLVDQMEEEGMSFTEVGKSFGLSAFGAAQWVRGYYAFRQARDETEFGGYINEQMYPYFQELFGRSSIALKDWLRWDDSEKKFEDQSNLNEFVSWFFPVDLEEAAEEEAQREPSRAEILEAWRNRRISKRDDLRNLSYLIHKSPKDWMEFRSGTELEKAYSRAVLAQMERVRRRSIGC